MTETNRNKRNDFLVSIFADDQVHSRLLSEIVKNQEDPLFKKELGLPQDFVFPFVLEEEEGGLVFKIQQESGSNYSITLSGSPCANRTIQSGDYFSFLGNKQPLDIKMFFINASEISLRYRKFRLRPGTSIYIGRTPNNEISYSLSGYVSREKHLLLQVDANGSASIKDLKNSVGLYVNGKKTQGQKLHPQDEIYFMGLSILYFGDWIAISDLAMECTLKELDSLKAKSEIKDGGQSYFVNTPRILKSLDDDEFEIDAPPNPIRPDTTPALLVIGPSMTMLVVMLASMGVSIFNALNGGNMATVISSAVMALGMLLCSLLWPMLLRRYQKKQALEQEEYRRDKYTDYIAEIEQQLIGKTERSRRLLNEVLCPSPEIICSFFDNEGTRLRLWERSIGDEDFLQLRLGLGSRPFDITIKTPREGFSLVEDDLRRLPVEIAKRYGTLSKVPLTLDLCSSTSIGIIGDESNVRHILEEMILDIAALHSYDEVKMIVIASPDQIDQFSAVKNIPHLWTNDKKLRFLATSPEEVHTVFSYLNEVLVERENQENRQSLKSPHYILLVTEPSLIEKEALFRYFDSSANSLGLSVVFAYGDITKLPKSVTTIIQSDEIRTGFYIRNQNRNRFITFTLDDLNEGRIQNFFSELTSLPIKRNSRTMGIVDSISFLQMYKAANTRDLKIEQHWDNNNSSRSLAAPIGVMAGGEIFSLDIHESYHGSHGLVAGTTGSGKSEFLQAYILSMAINYSPREVAFVLIDFKGGDMARPFMAKKSSPQLPHLAATISNLSGNTLYRALVSLDAEIKSRQRLFNESASFLGVDKLDINSYHKYFKSGKLTTPLPHLIIIIDEFAQLKTQQPEFLAELINVAQVGRSLGIHLILATQKPSGVVDPQIMSNSNFKVCLKVAEKQDSIDMINRPDSAFIKQPGRLNIQVGYDEIYETVQSGFSGAEYIPAKKFMPEEEITVQMTDHTGSPIHSARMDLALSKADRTQLEAVVGEIVELGVKWDMKAKPLWLEVLPDRISLHSLEKEKKGLASFTIGLVDYVRVQQQKPLSDDLIQSGHIAIYGASGMGKTTFLQSLVYSMVSEYQYTPEEVNFFAMDFGGRNLGYLNALPHTSGVVFAEEEEKLCEMIFMLQDMLEERKRLFSSVNCATFTDYRALKGTRLPAVVVLIDNFASFREKYMDLSDSIISLMGAARTFGIYFVVTGNNRNSIYYKAVENISRVYALKLNDPNTYLDILNARPPIFPEEIAGRGITVINREVVEFQIALASQGDLESDRLYQISQDFARINSEWNGFRPAKIGGEISSASSMSSLVNPYSTAENTLPEPIFEDEGNLILASSKSGTSSYGLDLTRDHRLCVLTGQISDLNPVYRSVIDEAGKYPGRKTVLIDLGQSAFSDLAERNPDLNYIQTSEQLDLFIESMRPDLNFRLENKGEGADQLFLIISEFNQFFDSLSDEQADFMRKVMQYINSPEYGICFVCGYDANGSKNNDSLFMKLIVNAQNYLLCPNSYEPSSQKIESLPLIPGIKSASSYLCLQDKFVEVR